jgi:hypothetical protein
VTDLTLGLGAVLIAVNAGAHVVRDVMIANGGPGLVVSEPGLRRS